MSDWLNKLMYWISNQNAKKEPEKPKSIGTKSEREFHRDKGWAGLMNVLGDADGGTVGGNVFGPSRTPMFTKASDDGSRVLDVKSKVANLLTTTNPEDWYFPEHDMGSLKNEEIKKAFEYYVLNSEAIGTSKFEEDLLEIMGKDVNAENKLAYMDYLIDVNADKLGFDSSGQRYKPITDESGNVIKYNTEQVDNTKSSTSPYDSGLDYYKSLIEDSLATNKNSEFAKQYQADMYGSINSYEQATNATLASAELDAYKMLGQQQLQLENQIAAQRMQALKSGVTSAQLASQELANMFAAQSSAQQVAQNVLAQRADVANTFNQQRAGVTDSLYNMLANNQTTAANAYAQLGAAQASYNSYMQQPWAQYQAGLQAAKSPYYETLMSTYNKSS